ncbi:hypothetical protein [Herbidospora sp. NBRC 101105]|uniref:hypothetical protein n=1 Tax=Herbidospora sp. NBRC 101105 TaxID=3032195 RepID=UPI0024A38053|nr:hypothetical protein [Herbidospora sp. NBRC 101105]GLX94784.1 hypothetical protein Hesp01_27340 [Herbidospora sp. NBRC 101105]
MPNLDFYAAEDDWAAVIEVVFDIGLFRVFERASEPGRELREFHDPLDVPDSRPARHLALFVVGSGPDPVARRVDRHPGDTTFHYVYEGRGIVQLDYGGLYGPHELRSTHTNHNTEKRAFAWAAALPSLGDPAASTGSFGGWR